jgi:uncharacterized protein
MAVQSANCADACWRNWRRLLYLCLFFILTAVAAAGAETPIPPPPTRWVTDTANFMSTDAADALNIRLQEYERGTGHQLVVWIGNTTGGTPIEDWAVRAFQNWKIGRKGLDDGLALFIMSEDRRLRIEVGYGLEGDVPDAIAARIINQIIVPRIQSGDRNGAVNSGMDAIMQVIGGQGVPGQNQRPERTPLTLAQLVLYGIVGLFILLFLATHPTLALYLLASILSGGDRRGSRGGGGWGSGGFGGGGGRSGGGGASGSW